MKLINIYKNLVDESREQRVDANKSFIKAAEVLFQTLI